MTRVEFTVLGVPAPQGSKRHVGRGVLVESSKALGPWRVARREAARQEASDRLAGILRRDLDDHRDLVAWLCSEHPIAGLTVSLNVTDSRDLSRIAILTGIVAEDTAGGSREA